MEYILTMIFTTEGGKFKFQKIILDIFKYK